NRDLREVERSEEPVCKGAGAEEERAAEEVDRHVGQRAARPCRVDLERQESVRGKEEYLERDEEVEQVAREEREVDARQEQEQEGQPQRVLLPRRAFRIAVERAGERRQRRKAEHDAAERVGDEYDAVGHDPAAQAEDE